MRVSIVISAIAACVLTPSMMAAQSRPLSFGVSGGASVPMSGLSDVVDIGYGVAGHVYMRPAMMGQIMGRGDVSYDRWNGKNSSKEHISSLAAVGNVVIPFAESMASARPYFVAGVGLYRFDQSYMVTGIRLSSASNNFGLQFGGGFEFTLAELSTYLEAKYVNVFSDGKNSGYLPITFGVRF